jgi:hypothetical protein
LTRYTGKLEIGHPQYKLGRFSVDMVYINNHRFIDEDDMKSAALAVRQQFMGLLYQNRFYTYGPPEVSMERIDNHMVRIVIWCEASRAKPEKVIIQAMKDHAPPPDPPAPADPGKDETRH